MSQQSTRRQFLKTATVGAAAVSMSAASYARVVGANDRISIGMIGCGSRGVGSHMAAVCNYSKEQNCEYTAVCDPWKVAREKAVAKTKEVYGREARHFVSYRDLLELEDIDAVMIASPDHVHTLHLKAAAEAKKDVYCEKPLSMDMDSLKAACDAVKESGVICQIGTQLRSLPSMTGVRELYKTGVLGKVGRIEQHRNSHQPYWYAYLKDVKEEDVDWNEFLYNAPKRPFSSDLYSGWYGYHDFSDGPVPGFGSHYIDLIHYITGAQFPESCVCLGGSYTCVDEDKFTNPDHVEALWTYPEGFMVTYSTNFGNGSGSSFKIFGDQAVLDLLDWNAPVLTTDGINTDKTAMKDKQPVEPIERPEHFLNWLQCLRSRETPHAPIEAGYQHAVAVIMGMKSYYTGRRIVYDHKHRELRKG